MCQLEREILPHPDPLFLEKREREGRNFGLLLI